MRSLYQYPFDAAYLHRRSFNMPVPADPVREVFVTSTNLAHAHSDSYVTGISPKLSLRVQVPNNKVLGIWVIVILVQIFGKHMVIGYLDA